jgi:GNAT superfamily N-acetyltransferase
VRNSEEIARDRTASISAEFDAFLPMFAAQAIDRGGEVLAARRAASMVGLLLYVREERGGSVFAPDVESVTALASLRAPAAFYAERIAGRVLEALELWTGELGPNRVRPPLRGPVRLAGPSDLDAVEGATARLAGALESRWVRPFVQSGAECMVAEREGRIVGLGWAERGGDRGRVHSLAVEPRYRRTGIGSDLVEARLRWLETAGARRVVSEISVDNIASQLAAKRSGMRRATPMYLCGFE